MELNKTDKTENNKTQTNLVVSSSELVNPLLTDFYQYSMVYAHWKNNKHNDKTVFDLYFRKAPFGLDYAIFGGLDECLDFIRNFKFTENHLNYFKLEFPGIEEEFLQYLLNLDCKNIEIYGYDNCQIVLPNEPILTLVGPLNVVQIAETTLLNLTNYPTLIGSLGHKLRTNFGNGVKFVDEDSCYAQSPYGGVLGIKYACVALNTSLTTNLLASKLYNIPLYIKNEINPDDEELNEIPEEINISNEEETIIKEFIKKTNYKLSNQFYSRFDKSKLYPQNMCYKVIMTSSDYDFHEFILLSILNFEHCNENQPILILECDQYDQSFKKLKPDEQSKKFIEDLNRHKHILSQLLTTTIHNSFSINNIKIATTYNTFMLNNNYNCDNNALVDIVFLGPEFLVSSTQPALGMVYKLMEINGNPCIKFSEEKGKQTIPGSKLTVRLFDANGKVIADYLCLKEEYVELFHENLKEIVSYVSGEEEKELTIKFQTSKIITKSLFSNETIKIKQNGINELQSILEHDIFVVTNNTNKIKLYISKTIRDIVVSEKERNRLVI